MPSAEKRDNAVQIILRLFVMLATGGLVALATHLIHFNNKQIIASAIFITIIAATLLFWKFRLAIAFIGISILIATNTMDLPTFIQQCQLDVIVFLIGMMVIAGVLKDLGLFTWIIQGVLKTPRMNGSAFVVITALLSALLSCLVDEVTSIIFIAALVFQVCDTVKISPMPFIIIAVLATNVGSTGSMLGNPVGILIGQNAQPPLGFLDFVIWSLPIMLLTLSLSICVLTYWFRRDIKVLSQRLDARRKMGLSLGPLVQVPYKRGLGILAGMICFIGLHHYVEHLLGLPPNTALIIAPLIIAGCLMFWRHERARHYIEHSVEWWTLLFFMFLFAIAGAMEHTSVTGEIAVRFRDAFGDHPSILTPVIIAISALGSAFIDNVVFVAAFMPVVNKLQHTPLLWALLQGACLGGNATMIGSTANIVALGMLEKRYKAHLRFLDWLKVGTVVAVLSCLTAWAGIAALSPFMPTPAQRLQKLSPHLQTKNPHYQFSIQSGFSGSLHCVHCETKSPRS